MNIELRQVTKLFGDFRALDSINFTIPSGQLVALLGPSGSGKTTLLRIIAGLDFPDQGTVLFEGEDATLRQARERGVGFVFQHYALFRHMTVFENIAFGLRVKSRKHRPTEAQIRKRVYELLELIQLRPLAERFPAQLSGGQRQRIALARALAVEPKVLLLDEPFGSLDAKVRYELRRWLRRLHDEIHVTSVFVTHDQEEALEVADLIVVMNKGVIVQSGSPDDVYQHPANSFVYNFLGNVNLFHGRIEGGIPFLRNDAAGVSGKSAKLYVRPHQLEISHESIGEGYVRAKIQHINSAGPLAKIELLTHTGDSIRVEMPQDRFRTLALERDLDVFVSLKEELVFSEDYSI